MFKNLLKKQQKINKQSESILAVFKKAKSDLEANIAESETVLAEIEQEKAQLKELEIEVAAETAVKETVLSKFKEFLGEEI